MCVVWGSVILLVLGFFFKHTAEQLFWKILLVLRSPLNFTAVFLQRTYCGQAQWFFCYCVLGLGEAETSLVADVFAVLWWLEERRLSVGENCCGVSICW